MITLISDKIDFGAKKITWVKGRQKKKTLHNDKKLSNRKK